MRELFVNSIVFLVIINVIYSLVPDNSYSKYFKFVVGITFAYYVLRNSYNIRPEILDVPENKNNVSSDFQAVIDREISEETVKKLENEISNDINCNVNVYMENNDIRKITVYNCKNKQEVIKIINEKYKVPGERIFFADDQP